jgi:uncharacterized integral membrane protein
MLVLILGVIFGLAAGYFATQNTAPVTIELGQYVIKEVPLYMVIIGALLVGLFVAWILYLAKVLSSRVTIYGKDTEVRKARRTIVDLEQRCHELEEENGRLKSTPHRLG